MHHENGLHKFAWFVMCLHFRGAAALVTCNVGGSSRSVVLNSSNMVRRQTSCMPATDIAYYVHTEIAEFNTSRACARELSRACAQVHGHMCASCGLAPDGGALPYPFAFRIFKYFELKFCDTVGCYVDI